MPSGKKAREYNVELGLYIKTLIANSISAPLFDTYLKNMNGDVMFYILA